MILARVISYLILKVLEYTDCPPILIFTNLDPGPTFMEPALTVLPFMVTRAVAPSTETEMTLPTALTLTTGLTIKLVATTSEV